MAGWPSAAQDRLPADVPRARHGRPGVPRRPLAVGARRMGRASFHTPTRVRASGTPVASRWMQVWLVASGERCVSSRAMTSTGTPRRISPDDHPYRARRHVSSLLHAADRAGADQGSRSPQRRSVSTRGLAAFTGQGRSVVYVLLDDEAVARCRAALESAGIGVADEREPGARPHSGRLAGRGTALPPHVPLVASEHNQMSLAGRRPHAAGPGCGTAGRPVLRPRAVGPRLGGADRPGRRPAARRALVGGRPVRRGAAGTPLVAADLRRSAPRRQGTRCAHRGTCPDRRAAARLPGRRRPAARPADPADPGPRAGSCRASAGMVL
jgi:hypothetical protein